MQFNINVGNQTYTSCVVCVAYNNVFLVAVFHNCNYAHKTQLVLMVVWCSNYAC